MRQIEMKDRGMDESLRTNESKFKIFGSKQRILFEENVNGSVKHGGGNVIN